MTLRLKVCGWEHLPTSPSNPQVSLARSPPVKNGEGAWEGLLLASYDRTLVVKDISSEEVAEMHNLLSEYHQVGPGGGGWRGESLGKQSP